MPNSKVTSRSLRRVKRLYPKTDLVKDGKPLATIVRPQEAAYLALAKQIQTTVKSLTGATLPIVIPEKVAERPRRNLILLGNLNNNEVIFKLYGFNYTPADDLYPGRGGYLFHSIHDPWGTGSNALGILGSDLDGVRSAADSFLQRLRKGRSLTVDRVFDVKFGPDAHKIPGLMNQPDLDSEMEAAEEALKRGEHTGLWGRIGERGLLYGLTGNEVYAELYKRLVFRMYEHAMSDPDNYGGIWGFDADFALHKVMPGWDLVEESPCLSDQERLRISKILFEFITDCIPHVGNMDVPHVRHNHTTFAALGLYYSGVYYSKYYGSKEAQNWISLADKCFQLQARAFKPHEDCSGYQWLTHYHLTKYSLSKGDSTFFDNGCARKAADYAILTTDNLGYALPYGDNASPFGWWSELPYLRASVCVMGDGRYQWMLNKKTTVESRYNAYEYHRNVHPVEPLDLDGMQTFPVDPLYYQSNDGESHLPYKKTVDKVVFRDGFDADAQYLFLDGLSNGGHKHYDGNSISRITENQRIWLADCDYIKSLPKFHNGVLIFKNGQSSEIPPFVELEHAENFGQTGFSETTLRNYSGVDWHRNIIWNRGRYFLVVDEMEAKQEDDYSFRAVWQTLGDVEIRDGGLAVEQNGEQFFITGLPGTTLKLEDDEVTGKNWAAYEHAPPVVRLLQQIADVHLRKRENYRYFNLLYCSDDEQPQRLGMTQLTAGCVRIDGMAEAVYAGVGDRRTVEKIPSGPEVAAAQFHLSPSVFSVVDGTHLKWGGLGFESEQPISMMYCVRSGAGTIVASRRTLVSFALDGRTAVLVDGKATESQKSRGNIIFEISRGRHEFSLLTDEVKQLRKLASKPVKQKKPGTSRSLISRQRVKSLKPLWTYKGGGPFLSVKGANLSGDVQQEVIAGGAGGDVCAIRGGESLWKFKTNGEVRSVWAADLENDGETEIIAGSADTKVYVIDSRGKKRWDFEIPLYYRKPMLRTVFAGDIDGDGNLEVVAGAESWRYYAFTHDGKELWHQMTVHSSTEGCAADIDGDGRAEVLAGTEYHRWHCIDGSGDIRWSYHPATGPRTNSVAAGDVDGDGLKEVVFAGADTNIHTLRADGKLLWQFNTGDEVTQVEVADLDGDGLDEVVACSMSFNVYVVKGDGKTQLWRRDLGEVVRCISVADFNGDGKLEVAAGTEDGVVYLLDNASGKVVGQHQMGGAILRLAAADVDGDSVDEVIASAASGELVALK
jgi:outer membrane protein assembly factor BamB